MGQFFHKNLVVRRTTGPQFLVVLTYFLVAKDARTLEFCYPVYIHLEAWFLTLHTIGIEQSNISTDKLTRFHILLRVYGQFSIETIHERRKTEKRICLAYTNRKIKCQNLV